MKDSKELLFSILLTAFSTADLFVISTVCTCRLTNSTRTHTSQQQSHTHTHTHTHTHEATYRNESGVGGGVGEGKATFYILGGSESKIHTHSVVHQTCKTTLDFLLHSQNVSNVLKDFQGGGGLPINAALKIITHTHMHTYIATTHIHSNHTHLHTHIYMQLYVDSHIQAIYSVRSYYM